jgi:hypothetical protein
MEFLYPNATYRPGIPDSSRNALMASTSCYRAESSTSALSSDAAGSYQSGQFLPDVTAIVVQAILDLLRHRPQPIEREKTERP